MIDPPALQQYTVRGRIRYNGFVCNGAIQEVIQVLKLTAFLTRRADLTREQFDEHWSEKHASLERSLPEVQANVRRYVQQTVSDGLPAAVPTPSYDGVGELWFGDLNGALAALTSENYQTIVIPDEEKFLDRSKMKFLLTTERVII